ncbi:MAG: GFA family protein [Pseudomonadota bacterium]
MTLKGHCLCKEISFELEGEHNWVGHCHCDSCRRGAGAPLVTFIGHPNGAWRWTGLEPTAYESTPGNTRFFCKTCGSSVAYRSVRYPEEMHFHAALFEDPSQVMPKQIYHKDERLSWMPEYYPGCGKEDA